MSSAGRILIASVHVNAATTAVPASGSDSTELIAALSSEISGIEVVNSVGETFELLLGPTGGLDRMMLVAGRASAVIHHQRQPCLISKGMRLSFRNIATTAAATGIVTINLWG